jgi:GNAT superfamily N-acetyltransferase
MLFSDLVLIRLTNDHTILPFDCDDNDLNSFLFDDAKLQQQDLQSVTYLFQGKDCTVAFFSVLNDKISYEQFNSNAHWKKLARFNKRKKSYPAIKLGRLGVDKSHQNKGFGMEILNYLKIFSKNESIAGCKFITVDAYRQSLNFYQKIGFIFMSERDKNEDTRAMYFDLSLIPKSL